jgi:malate synthase
MTISDPRTGPIDTSDVLTDDAVEFLNALHREFEPRRLELLAGRENRAAALHGGTLPDFLPGTAAVREGDWRVAPAPAEIADRRVEESRSRAPSTGRW